MSTDADPQSARSWSTTPERSNLLAIQTIAWIATHLGRHVARLVLHPIALYYLLFAPAARRASRRYLGRALGRPAGWTDLYRHIHAFASVALDRVWFAAGRVDLFDLRICGGAVMETALAEGRGVYLVGAHIGSFEALHAVGLSKRQLPVAMVMYPENARMIHTVLQALAPDFDVSIIPIGQRGSALTIRDFLDKGGLTGLMGDRYMPSQAVQEGSVERLFLGMPAQFTDGPVRLAMMLRRRVIFMVGLYRGGNRYDVRFEELADFRQPPADPGEREALVLAAVADYVRRLEALCLEAPYNWFNFYDYWHEDAAA
ncbi:MAG: acyl-CoA synthetase [Inhella sp.]|jgi:predicted LPLAT superfamily acyltransferase|uniref:LpxL/LpxP family acyltransferase n=1 Tax=Inhella sp. TaxID=1921806 RepID=UPI0022BB53C1|nr:acyl-CoA synthetase [Inhella sp.]MCZ8234391.1 acyl-CoA synthetase [Inhella sp.]